MRPCMKLCAGANERDDGEKDSRCNDSHGVDECKALAAFTAHQTWCVANSGKRNAERREVGQGGHGAGSLEL